MDQVLDSDFQKSHQHDVIYGGFWPRFGALFLDGLILGVPTFAISYFNITSWKSSALLIIISIIDLAYKPFMEFQYGATLGKMALNLQVVDLDFQKPNFAAIFLRNIFNITSSAASLAFTLIIFNMVEFQQISGYLEYAQLTKTQPGLSLFQIAYFIILIAEIICLLSDNQKRSLHDRIGKTYVIVKT